MPTRAALNEPCAAPAALQVVVPLISAPLAVLLRRAAGFVVTTLASWAAFAVAIALWLATADGTVLSYAMGSWPPPGASSIASTAVELRAAARLGHGRVILPYSRASIAREIPATALPVLRDVRALPHRPARHHDHRDAFNVCLPRDLVAFHLLLIALGPTGGRWWPPTRPGDGHDRGDVHRIASGCCT